MKLVKVKGKKIHGWINNNGDIVTAINENGSKGIEIIKATKEQLEDLLPELSGIYNVIKSFFESIFIELPCFITIEGRKFVKTEQRAPWAAIDKIFYLYEGDHFEDGEFSGKKIFQFEGKTIDIAKSELRRYLKSTGHL